MHHGRGVEMPQLGQVAGRFAAAWHRQIPLCFRVLGSIGLDLGIGSGPNIVAKLAINEIEMVTVVTRIRISSVNQRLLGCIPSFP